MSQAELLALVVARLNELEIDYMLTGSHASSFYGEARSTHDIDMVVDLPERKILALVRAFPSDRYYISESAIREGRMAKLIDTVSGDKVDFFFLDESDMAQTAFRRRRRHVCMGVSVQMTAAEDLVLSKLDWSRRAGGSDQQLRDVRKIVESCRSDLDQEYLIRQAELRQLGDEVRRLLTH
ncbi:MAG: hypothetical protein AAGA03_04050 [Planctomycetota bacterium]